MSGTQLIPVGNARRACVWAWLAGFIAGAGITLSLLYLLGMIP